MIGLSQIQLNKYDDAKISFIRAIRLNKKLYDARTRLGLIYLSEANFDEARYQLIKLNDARMRCKHKCRDSAQIKSFEIHREGNLIALDKDRQWKPI